MKLEFKERSTLGEMSFRKFEHDIAAACKGTIVINTLKRIPSLKPSSYAVQVRDALKSFATNNWGSTLIPPCYEVGRIKVRITKDEQVALVNEYEDKMGTKNDRLSGISKEVRVVVDKDGNYVKGGGAQKQECLFFLDYRYPGQLDEIMEISGKMNAREDGKYGLDWLVKVKVEDEDDAADLEQKVVSSYPDLMIEILDHKYYRIVTYKFAGE